MLLPQTLPPALVRPLLVLSRIGFVVALAIGVTMAVLPPADSPEVMPWDKAQHFVCFYVLAVLGAFAFPRLKLIWLAAGLSGLGAAIEIVQALPIVARDSDIKDWIADTIAVACALCPMLIGEWRRRLAPTAS